MKYSPDMIKFILDLKDARHTHKEITEKFNKAYGLDKTLKAINKTIERYNYGSFDPDAVVNAEKSKVRLSMKMSEMSTTNKAIIKSIVTQEDFLAEFQKILKEQPIKMHKPLKQKASTKKTKRTILAHVSDTHIGVCIKSKEMDRVNQFNPTVAARRFAYFFKQVAEYKVEHRSETDLVLLLNGDILSGIIHDQEWGVLPMTTQLSIAMSIFTQGISYLANNFQKVKVICTVGNHGRYMHKENKGRAANMKWDSFDTNLYVALKYALKSFKNVNFEIPETPYARFKIFGHSFFATHGDTVVNVGNVSASINIKNIKNQLNEISSALDEKIDVALLGHVHKATWQTLDNGTELLINGTLSGTDGFAQSIGILHSNPAQQIIEVTETYPVGDVRFVRVKGADDLADLDKIVEPMLDNF